MRRLTAILMLLLAALVVATACETTPLTPEEIQARADHELDRRERFVAWRQWCKDRNYAFGNDGWVRTRCDYSGDPECIAHRSDWDFRYVGAVDLTERNPSWAPRAGNNIICGPAHALIPWL